MYKLRIRMGELKSEDKRKVEGLVCECQDYEEIGIDLDTQDKQEDTVWGMLFHDTVLVSVLQASRVEETIVEMKAFTKPTYRESHCFKRVLGRVLRHMRKEGLLDLSVDSVLFPVEGGEDAYSLIAHWNLQSAYSEYVLVHPTIKGWEPELSVAIEKSKDRELLTRLHSSIFDFEVDASREFIKSMMKDSSVTPYVIYQNKVKTKECDITSTLTAHLSYEEKDAAGMFFLVDEEQAVWLCGFGLLPLYRRRGIASQALDFIVTDQVKNADEVLLQVSDANEPAFALYTNYGFTDRRILTYYELNRQKIEELSSIK